MVTVGKGQWIVVLLAFVHAVYIVDAQGIRLVNYIITDRIQIKLLTWCHDFISK